MPKMTVGQLIERLQAKPEWAGLVVLVHDGLDPSDLQPVSWVEEETSPYVLACAGLPKHDKAISLR